MVIKHQPNSSGMHCITPHLSICHSIFNSPSSDSQCKLVHSLSQPQSIFPRIKNPIKNKKNSILEHGFSSVFSFNPLKHSLVSTPFQFLVHSLKFWVSLSFVCSISMAGGSENQQEKHVYSVWGLPQEDLRPRLKKLMECLRSEFNGPEFDPHVTVVGAICLTENEARDRFNKACQGLKAYKAKVEKVATGTFFYQCVFLLLEQTPEVVETSDHCCGHFGYVRSTPYMPHLSLLYGDISEEEKKAAQEKAYALDETIGNLDFEISVLVLYKTDTEDKSLKSWEKVAEYHLISN